MRPMLFALAPFFATLCSQPAIAQRPGGPVPQAWSVQTGYVTSRELTGTVTFGVATELWEYGSGWGPARLEAGGWVDEVRIGGASGTQRDLEVLGSISRTLLRYGGVRMRMGAGLGLHVCDVRLVGAATDSILQARQSERSGARASVHGEVGGMVPFSAAERLGLEVRLRTAYLFGAPVRHSVLLGIRYAFRRGQSQVVRGERTDVEPPDGTLQARLEDPGNPALPQDLEASVVELLRESSLPAVAAARGDSMVIEMSSQLFDPEQGRLTAEAARALRQLSRIIARAGREYRVAIVVLDPDPGEPRELSAASVRGASVASALSHLPSTRISVAVAAPAAGEDSAVVLSIFR